LISCASIEAAAPASRAAHQLGVALRRDEREDAVTALAIGDHLHVDRDRLAPADGDLGAMGEERRIGGIAHPLAVIAVHTDDVIDDMADHRGAADVAQLLGGGVDEEDDAVAVDQQRGDGMRLDQLVMVERGDARRQRAHAAALLRCGP
jgi:hypothetical protein